MEETGASADPTVTLTADAAPFEAALDKAGAAVGGWASRVTSKFDGLSTAISAKTAKISGAIGSIQAASAGAEAGEAGDKIGEAVGMAAGGAIGTMFGGPIGIAIGAALGGKIGSALSGVVDFESLLGGATAGQSLFAEIRDDARETWGKIKETFGEAWAGLKEVARTLSIKDLLSGDLDAIGARFEAMLNNVAAKAREVAGSVIARTVDLIDRTVERLKGPVGAVADFVQKVLVRIGLVGESTDRWGDAFRNLQDVGETAFVGLAKGLGYVRTAVELVGAAVYKNLISPIVDGVRGALDAVKALAATGKDLPGAAGETFAAIERGVGVAEERIGKIDAALIEASNAALARSVHHWADKWGKDIGEAISQSRLENLFKDSWKLLFPGAGAGPEEQGPGIDFDEAWGMLFPGARDAAEGPAKRVQANIAGGQDAMRAIIASTDANANTSPEVALLRMNERAAKAAEEAAAVEKENQRILRRAVDLLDQINEGGGEWATV